ncbi:MAG: hypothetical protein SPI06_08130 [Terrisporobacter sp.]|uniref:hypothetical protein n=1 Tax=Terrisporobacter sp. TaxID=1965305 RepID=UPI002A91AA1C|nr:hypothetical protein [Terrisporobacter sp.]MDY6153365.1 hypothetical protein [Terrisporobacter sp.]
MISKGNASKEAQEFKRFIGICPVFVKAVNPNKAEHEKLFNTTLEEAPIYVQDKEDSDGNSYKNVRISVVLQPDTEKIGFDMPLVTMPLFITNQKQHGANSGKYQVVDKYGRFAWATEAEISAKEIPTYSNGKKADISNDYRIAYVGEEDLTNFIRVFLCIPSITKWDNNEKCMVPNTDVKPEECECRLDIETFEKFFKGDFSDIKDILGFQPTNKIKVCLGVRTDANGKLFQSVYTKKFISNAATNYSSLDKALQADIAYATTHNKALSTEYSAKAVHEYSVTPTTFTASESSEVTPSSDMPFDDSSDPFA